MSATIYVAIPLMFLLTVIQTAVLPRFPIFGLTPQLPLLFALAWGLLRGLEEGVIWAFIGGLLVDLLSVGPTGLTALTAMLGIFVVIWLQQTLPANRVFLPILFAGLATFITLLVHVLLLRLLGYLTGLQAVGRLPAVALLHAGLILPVYWTMYWIDRRLRPARVQL